MDEQQIPLEEVAWSSVLQTGGIMYLVLSLALAVIMIISTSVTCSKQHFGASFQLGLILTVVPVLIYAVSSKYTFIRKPFASVIEMMGISPERALMFGGAYILLLFLLPLTVYGIHSAEDSACVATADEMSSFKTKMLKELQEKQEAEEKNALKK